MAHFLNVCRFRPTAGGTTDWTYSSFVTGYNSPALAGVVNGLPYKYRAESADLAEWEIGEGVYNAGVLARTTVLANSAGTGTSAGQSGAGSKINFSTVPQVAIVALKEDLPGLNFANVFTDTTEATGAGTTASALFAGGVEIAKKLFVVGSLLLGNHTTVGMATWIAGNGNQLPALFVDRTISDPEINDNDMVFYTELTAVSNTGIGNQYASINIRPIIVSTIYNWQHRIGIEDFMTYNGSGTLGYDTTLVSGVTYNGPVTERKAFWVADFAGTGSCVDQYGLYVNSLTKGTNNWAVYTAGTTASYFGGPVTANTSLTSPIIKSAGSLIFQVDGGDESVRMDTAGNVLQGITAVPALGDTGNGVRYAIQGASNTYGYIQLMNDTAGTVEFGRLCFGSPTYSDAEKRAIVISAGSSTSSTATPTGRLYFFVNSGSGLSIALTLQQGLGVGTGTDPGLGAILCNTSIKSQGATAGIGYATGSGGTATAQATDKSTGVTFNKINGTVTMNAASLAANTAVSFTLTNSAIAATDYVHCQHESVGTIGAYMINARATGSGTAQITIRNVTAGALAEAIVLRLIVIKSVNA